jgi:hypothetical protein
VIWRAVRFLVERYLLVPSCVACGCRATGEGPDGKPRCLPHCKLAWHKVELNRVPEDA